MSVAGNSSSSSRSIPLPPPVTEADFRQILGIRFYVGQPAGLMELTKQGGLIAVPSAPVLTRLTEDEVHRVAVEGCDFAITDSGFMVLLWRFIKRDRLVRISGLRFLQALLELPEFCTAGATFWVMPTQEDSAANIAWLATRGVAVSNDQTYLAPMFPSNGALRDEALLAQIEKTHPAFVILCLGGGVQERLGYYLRCNLSFRPTIICTGAAIAFLSGRQTSIPKWADRLFLGWLFRFLSSPRRFFPRYWDALRLFRLIQKYGNRSVSL
jgi:UDP-N-acetyl-D-mannosaminuronic acid transferase (WecB/TagA/CpsF family)